MSLFSYTNMFIYNNPFNSFLNGFSPWNNFSFDNSVFNNPWGNFSYGDTFTRSSSTVKSSGGGNGGGSVRQLYNSLGLEKEGLKYEVFAFTMKGYNNLSNKGNGRLGIVDPYQKKYYLIDIKNSKFLEKTDIKLGYGNMESVAGSNKIGSGATLSGFEKVESEYKATKAHWSNIGIRKSGLEQGINNNSMAKATVIHSTTGNQTAGCIGVTPIYRNGQQDKSATDAKLRRLFTKDTILFTYPKNVDEYKRLSSLV